MSSQNMRTRCFLFISGSKYPFFLLGIIQHNNAIVIRLQFDFINLLLSESNVCLCTLFCTFTYPCFLACQIWRQTPVLTFRIITTGTRHLMCKYLNLCTKLFISMFYVSYVWVAEKAVKKVKMKKKTFIFYQTSNLLMK